MKRALIVAAMCAASAVASATCTGFGAGDRWTGEDKTKHLIGGAIAGSLGTLVF